MDEIDRKTTVLILGDARNNNAEPRADILRKIHDCARRVIFPIPEPKVSWNTGDSVMKTYEPLRRPGHRLRLAEGSGAGGVGPVAHGGVSGRPGNDIPWGGTGGLQTFASGRRGSWPLMMDGILPAGSARKALQNDDRKPSYLIPSGFRNPAALTLSSHRYMH